MLNKLIVRMPNWVGDVIMALPALNLLKKANIELELIGKAWLNNLLSGHDFAVHRLPASQDELIACYKALAIEPVLLLTNSFSSAKCAWLAKKKTVGFRGDMRRFFLHHPVKKKTKGHEVEHFYQLASVCLSQVFNQDSLNTDKTPVLMVPDEAMHEAKSVLDAHGIGEFGVVCPGAQGVGLSSQTKRWPKWRELSATVHLDKPLIACPGPGEESLFDSLLSPRVTLIKDIDLITYAAILKRSSFVVANDSGPMHMAQAVGANVLGIFGTTLPERTSPWGGRVLGELGQWPGMDDVIKTLSEMND